MIVSRGFVVAGKVDTYRSNLEHRRRETIQNSTFAVAVAHAAFKRNIGEQISMDNVDSSEQGIRYIDQEEEEHDRYDSIDLGTDSEQQDPTINGAPDSNEAVNKNKNNRGISSAQKMRWQKSLEAEDMVDGPTIIQKTQKSMMLSQPSDKDTLITKIIQLDNIKLKQRRNDRLLNVLLLSQKNLFLINFRKNVRVADLTIQDDKEYFSDFVTMRWNIELSIELQMDSFTILFQV